MQRERFYLKYQSTDLHLTVTTSLIPTKPQGITERQIKGKKWREQ